MLQLKKGWTWDSRSRRFIKGDQSFLPGADLPKRTSIRFQVPELAAKQERTPDEDKLARSLQVVPPRGVAAEQLLNAVQSWPCAEKAWISPTVSPAAPAPD